jgi:hypothetical protein
VIQLRTGFVASNRMNIDGISGHRGKETTATDEILSHDRLAKILMEYLQNVRLRLFLTLLFCQDMADQ